MLGLLALSANRIIPMIEENLEMVEILVFVYS